MKTRLFRRDVNAGWRRCVCKVCHDMAVDRGAQARLALGLVCVYPGILVEPFQFLCEREPCWQIKMSPLLRWLLSISVEQALHVRASSPWVQATW